MKVDINEQKAVYFKQHTLRVTTSKAVSEIGHVEKGIFTTIVEYANDFLRGKLGDISVYISTSITSANIIISYSYTDDAMEDGTIAAIVRTVLEGLYD